MPIPRYQVYIQEKVQKRYDPSHLDKRNLSLLIYIILLCLLAEK